MFFHTGHGTHSIPQGTLERESIFTGFRNICLVMQNKLLYFAFNLEDQYFHSAFLGTDDISLRGLSAGNT